MNGQEKFLSGYVMDEVQWGVDKNTLPQIVANRLEENIRKLKSKSLEEKVNDLMNAK